MFCFHNKGVYYVLINVVVSNSSTGFKFLFYFGMELALLTSKFV